MELELLNILKLKYKLIKFYLYKKNKLIFCINLYGFKQKMIFQ